MMTQLLSLNSLSHSYPTPSPRKGSRYSQPIPHKWGQKGQEFPNQTMTGNLFPRLPLPLPSPPPPWWVTDQSSNLCHPPHRPTLHTPGLWPERWLPLLIMPRTIYTILSIKRDRDLLRRSRQSYLLSKKTTSQNSSSLVKHWRLAPYYYLTHLELDKTYWNFSYSFKGENPAHLLIILRPMRRQVFQPSNWSPVKLTANPPPQNLFDVPLQTRLSNLILWSSTQNHSPHWTPILTHAPSLLYGLPYAPIPSIH